MLSKVFGKQTQLCLKKSQPFSLSRVFFDMVYKDNKSDSNYQVTYSDPRKPIGQGKSRDFVKSEVQTTKLANGVTVVTETAAVPSRVDFGVLLNVGTRDETTETSGSLLSIQNTYLKTVLNTNETINYGVVQQSGGSFEMDFNQEQAYFHANCLAHDGVDVFSMVADCALEPRSVLAADVGIAQNQDSHKLDAFLKTGEDFNDAVFRTAFGTRGVGLPLKGLKGNVSNLTSYVLQQFQLKNITPDKIFVASSGIDSHQEFVDLVQHKLSYIPASTGSAAREATQYLGGEVRNLTEENSLQVSLYFQGANWNSADVWALQLAQVLLNGPRLKQLLAKKSYIDNGAALNTHFTDSGLFGLRLRGSANNANALLDDTVSTLKGVATTVSADELQRAKNILKTNILLRLQSQTNRLEETVKNIATFGQVKTNTYSTAIDSVTAEQVSQAVATVLKTNPTFVAWGGEANKLKSFDAVKTSLQ